MIRLLEIKTDKKHSIRKIINSMINFTAELDTENIYKLFGADDIIKELINIYNLNDDIRKYMPRKKIRKILKY